MDWQSDVLQDRSVQILFDGFAEFHMTAEHDILAVEPMGLDQ